MNSEIVAFVVVLAYFLLHFTWLLSPILFDIRFCFLDVDVVVAGAACVIT